MKISDDLEIADEELLLTTARSSGPGGQNVNKVETRVELHFNLAASPSLTAEQKALLAERLATRISKAGVLRLSCQKFRTQAANRREAVERFGLLVREALVPVVPRRPTRTPRRAAAARRRGKLRRGEVKRLRARPGMGEE